MRRFAQDTTVPISRSRGEVDELLRGWGAEGVQWTDEWGAGKVTLRFVWPKGGGRYQARLSLTLPTDDAIRALPSSKIGPSWNRRVSEARVRDAIAARGKREHRLLLLWLKAAFNAVDAGLVAAEVIFLPFLEGRDGETVAERALPRMADLLVGSADRLLLGAPQ